MKNYTSLLFFTLIGMLFFSFGAYADADTCVSSPKYQSANNVGNDIIKSIFDSINLILQDMTKSFYNSVVHNKDYQFSVRAAVLLYITVYGAMIMFNLAPANTAEVTNRLFKIAIVWSIMGGGWGFFDQWVGTPFIGAMNDLIKNFSAAASTVNPSVVAVANPLGSAAAPVLDNNIMNPLTNPMSNMFSVKYSVAILALFFTGYTGWIFALFLIWGLVQFLMMLVGAIVTYIKAIVGLAFLFALAPIFFAFILFERTRQIFMGWINQVLGFVFQPVLLFAFLGFYATLIDNALTGMLFSSTSPDFCWAKWFSMPGNIFDVYWWRPQILPNNPAGGDWYGPPPIKIIDIFYFIFLTHLAKNFSEFIEELSGSLAGGSGPGVVKGSSVGSFISHKTGFQGKGLGGAAIGAVGGLAGGAKWGYDKMVGNRKGVGEGASTSSTPSNANQQYENKASVLSSKDNFSKGVPRPQTTNVNVKADTVNVNTGTPPQPQSGTPTPQPTPPAGGGNKKT